LFSTFTRVDLTKISISSQTLMDLTKISISSQTRMDLTKISISAQKSNNISLAFLLKAGPHSPDNLINFGET
jgi:hypothetical protein